MTESFDFFFDFSSPYAYLAHKQIREIEKQNSIKINYLPILLGGLHKLAGITAGFLIPPKVKFIIRDCKLLAEKFNINFKFNTFFPINTLVMMRGTLFAEKKNIFKNYINKFFDAYWKESLNLTDEKIFNSILKNLNIDPNEFYIFISEQKLKDDLKNRTQNAYLKGVFGTPTFIINNKLFWGQDRLEFVLKEAKK